MVEAFVILVVAAGLSALVVWWALSPPRGRPEHKEGPNVSAPPRSPQTATALVDEANPDGFVLGPEDVSAPPDDRPPAVLSLVRLALTITFVAALAVGILAVLGYLVKAQLDQYFTGL